MFGTNLNYYVVRGYDYRIERSSKVKITTVGTVSSTVPTSYLYAVHVIFPHMCPSQIVEKRKDNYVGDMRTKDFVSRNTC